MCCGKELTDDWKIHLKPNMLKEFKSIHVWHVDITDYNVISIFPLAKQAQCISS